MELTSIRVCYEETHHDNEEKTRVQRDQTKHVDDHLIIATCSYPE